MRIYNNAKSSRFKNSSFETQKVDFNEEKMIPGYRVSDSPDIIYIMNKSRVRVDGLTFFICKVFATHR